MAGDIFMATSVIVVMGVELGYCFDLASRKYLATFSMRTEDPLPLFHGWLIAFTCALNISIMGLIYATMNQNASQYYSN